MSNKYLDLLDEPSKERYMEKLSFNSNKLPDPLDEDIRNHVFVKSDLSKLPSIMFGDLYMYLVLKECSYTHERFQCFKALDCYNYVLSGKVRDILSYQNKDLKVCVLTCDVEASQTVGKLHRPWVVVSMDGRVHSGHCTCMAGLGEVCSHVSALLFAVEIANREEAESPSPTSLPCAWNRSMKKVPPIPAAKMQFSHKRKASSKQNYPTKLPSKEAYNEFIVLMKETNPTAPYLSVLPSESSDSDDGEQSESESNLLADFDVFKAARKYYEDLQKKVPEADLNNSILEKLRFSKDIIDQVEENTRDQNKSPSWMSFRCGRLTASLFGNVLRCTERGVNSIVQKVVGQSKPFVNAAIKWGINNECYARQRFTLNFEEMHVNGQVFHTGLRVDEEFGFLGATPDGRTECDCCEPALIEIKCPYRGKGLQVKDIKLEYLDENLSLKEKHQYYDQIQGQMDIWRLYKCYFVTYTDVDFHVEVIEKNEEYWSFKKPRLIEFYKKHVLPQILNA